MGNVGNGGDQVAFQPKDAGCLHQYVLRVDEVFQDIAEHRHVKLLAAQGVGEVERLDVAHDHAVGEARRELSGNGILLDPRYAAAALLEDASDVTGRGPHLQDSLVAARQENELSESRITIRQIDAVVVVPKGVPDHGIYCTPTLRDRRGEPTA